MTPPDPRFCCLAVALLLACSGGNTGGDGTGPAHAGPEAYGLSDRQCAYFADDAGTGCRMQPGYLCYSVQMLKDDTSIGGVRAWHLIHRVQGFEKRSDWVEVSDQGLRLHRRQDFDAASSTLYRYSPPPVVARAGMKDGDSVETPTTATVNVGGSGSSRTDSMTFLTTALAVDPFQAGAKTVTPVELLVSAAVAGGTPSVDKLWLAENSFFVRLQRAGDAQFTLDHVSPAVPGSTAGVYDCPLP